MGAHEQKPKACRKCGRGTTGQRRLCDKCGAKNIDAAHAREENPERNPSYGERLSRGFEMNLDDDIEDAEDT